MTDKMEKGQRPESLTEPRPRYRDVGRRESREHCGDCTDWACNGFVVADEPPILSCGFCGFPAGHAPWCTEAAQGKEAGAAQGWCDRSVGCFRRPGHFGQCTDGTEALPEGAQGAAPLDSERLVRAFYNTPRKPGMAETEAEHIGRAAVEYSRLSEEESW